MGLLHNPFDQMDTPFDRQNTFSSRPYLNSALSRFALCASLRLHPPSSPTGRGGLRRPGGKGARNAFLLSQGKVCFAKITSIRHCRTMCSVPHCGFTRLHCPLGTAASAASHRTCRCCGLHLEGLRPLQTTQSFQFSGNLCCTMICVDNFCSYSRGMMQIFFCYIPCFVMKRISGG